MKIKLANPRTHPLSRWSGFILTGTGFIALTGNGFSNLTHSTFPVSITVSSWLAMNPSAATCLALYGIFLWRKRTHRPQFGLLKQAHALPLLGMVISGAAILEYWFQGAFSLMPTHPLTNPDIPSDSPPLFIANCLLLLGGSLLLGQTRSKKARLIARTLSLSVVLLAVATLLAAFYNTLELAPSTEAMSRHIAVWPSLCLLTGGIASWSILGKNSLSRIISTQATGSMMSRVLLFSVVALPLLQITLRFASVRHLISPAMEMALSTVIAILFLAALIVKLSQGRHKAEKSLLASQKHLQRLLDKRDELNERLGQQKQILENALEGIAEIGSDGIYRSVNKTYAQSLGYTPAELIGQHWLNSFPDTERDNAQNLHQEALLYGKTQAEASYQSKNGKQIHQQVVFIAARSATQIDTGHYQFTRDITAQKQNEHLLQEAAQKFTAIFNQAFQFIGLMKPNGVLLEANLTTLDDYGLAHNTQLNKPLWTADWWRYNTETETQLKRGIQQAARNEFVRFESRHPKVGGREISLDFSIKPIQDEGGQVVLLLCEGRDITALKQAQETLRVSEERLRMAIECSGQGFWDWNIDPAKTHFDVHWHREKPEESANRESILENWQEMVHPEDWENNMAALQAHTSGEAPNYQSEYRQKDGNEGWIWVRSLGKVVERDIEGNVTRVIGMSQNVTAQKENEALLEKAKQEAEQASQFKSQFLATMSHEIRTPINGILGLTELTLNSRLNKEQQENLEMVYTSGRSLLNIVNDILDFSKIEAGKMELAPITFNLHHCIREVTHPFLSIAQSKALGLNFQVTADVPEWLYGDQSKLRQILNNLLDNAIKFTQSGSIELKIRQVARKKDNVQLEFNVIDTGIGLQTEQMEKIFAPFVQAESSTNRRFGGTGLGLSISLQLAELMDGSIQVESQPGQGSTFTLTLWLKETIPPSEESGSPPSKPRETLVPTLQQKAQHRILIVEDNEINLKLAEHILVKAGYAIDYATNGKKALEKIECQNYDLILMDIHMPELDGFQTTAAIRQNESARHTPIIALTADTIQGYRERCIEAGMDSYLPKPYHKDALLQEVRTLLSSKTEKSDQACTSKPTHNKDNWLDFNAILAHSQGDSNLLRKMAPLLTKRSQDLLEKMELALHSEERKQFKDHAHALKGTLGNFTTAGPFETVLQLEQEALTAKIDSLFTKLSALRKQIQALQTLLIQHISP